MNIGKMDTLLTIESFNEYPASAGTPIKAWSTFCQLWGHVSHKSGGERSESDQKVGFETVEVTCHKYYGITQSMRVYMLEDYYRILDVDYSDRQKVKLVLTKRDNQ